MLAAVLAHRDASLQKARQALAHEKHQWRMRMDIHSAARHNTGGDGDAPGSACMLTAANSPSRGRVQPRAACDDCDCNSHSGGTDAGDGAGDGDGGAVDSTGRAAATGGGVGAAPEGVDVCGLHARISDEDADLLLSARSLVVAKHATDAAMILALNDDAGLDEDPETSAAEVCVWLGVCVRVTVCGYVCVWLCVWLVAVA